MKDGKANVQNWTDAEVFVQQFVDEREWEVFHTLKNLSIGLSVEAAELAENVLWQQEAELEIRMGEDKEFRETIENEFADILFLMLRLSRRYNVSPWEVLMRKVALNAAKYPVELARGNALKYTRLPPSEARSKQDK